VFTAVAKSVMSVAVWVCEVAALPSRVVWRLATSAMPMASIVLTWAAVRSSGSPVLAVTRPLMRAVAMSASLAFVIALFATVPAPPPEANDTSPEPKAGRRAAARVPERSAADPEVATVASPETSAAAIARIVLTWAAVRSSGSPVPAVARPLIRAVTMSASLAFVTPLSGTEPAVTAAST